MLLLYEAWASLLKMATSAPDNNSIQSFYPKEIAPPTRIIPGAHPENEAFTSAELAAAQNPLTQSWRPKGVYHPTTISSLQPGPGKVRFMARIVNFIPSTDGPSRTMLPQGFHLLIVKDDTGVVALRLLRSTGDDTKFLKLGALVTVWAAFVGTYTPQPSVRVPLVSLIIPVHPAQGSASCIKFHDAASSVRNASLCRLPLQYDLTEPSAAMSGIMNLRAYLNSGHEGIPNVRILICIYSVGTRKTIRSERMDKSLDLVEVQVFDETSSCLMKVWEHQVQSAKAWIPNQTVLLITNPKMRPPDKRSGAAELIWSRTCTIEVDPACPDAEWLRRMAVERTKREAVHIPFPEGIWDVQKAIHGPQKTLFTLADIDIWAREDPEAVFTGKLNLLISSVSIMNIVSRTMLCCVECCGVPVYCNKPNATCKNCMKPHSLALNPRIIGSLTDETGSIAGGKLIWSNQAWADLLFGANTTSTSTSAPSGKVKSELQPRVDVIEEDYFGEEDPFSEDPLNNRSDDSSWKILATLDNTALREVEEQLLYSRVTLTFGWSPAVGRLCVLGVEW